MTLREARCIFTKHLAMLVLDIIEEGYEVAFDEVTERITAKDPTSDHMPNSLHHLGLAADLLLYRNGVYLSKSEEYTQFGERWEAFGKEHNIPLRWGGRFKDGNHFSLEWGGKK